MIQVRITKRQNRHVFKNALGKISKKDFKTYGVGKYPTMPHKTEVKIGTETHFILNTELELVR